LGIDGIAAAAAMAAFVVFLLVGIHAPVGHAMPRTQNSGQALWATHSKLPEVIKVAKLIRSHLNNVLSYYKHRITNAVAEGLNSKIATIQKRAYGFRNFQNFQIAVYFHCGGLALWPARGTHTKV
jgi:hypothetical protein